MAFKIKGLSGEALCQDYMAKHGPDTTLGFSCGKDSIATALAIVPYMNVVPIFYYIVPGLPMEEESLDYYERKLFKRKILRYPDHKMFDWLQTGVHLPMRHYEIIEACDPELPNPIHSDGGIDAWRRRRNKWIEEQEHLDPRALNAIGVTARDSPVRYMSFQKHGQIRPKSGAWYPIWSYDRATLLGEIERSGVKLPIDYHLFGKSFDGLSIEYLYPIYKHRPQDWKVILEWYPLAEADVWKHERNLGITSAVQRTRR
jgi:hypothetical protein